MIIDIIRSNFKIIIFGFVFTFFSSVGQSFFIGLFNSSIREELNSPIKKLCPTLEKKVKTKPKKIILKFDLIISIIIINYEL